jgi:SagB-type dehydrogenase family enzyme
VPVALALTSQIATGQTVLGQDQHVRLPAPRLEGSVSVEAALQARQSVRDFTDASLTIEELGQVLWAAQGINRREIEWGAPPGRTAPSAGALYPLELYVVVGSVEGLPVGVYRYRPEEHDLAVVGVGDHRSQLANVAVRQTWMRDAAVMIVIAGVYARTTGKYGERGRKYVHMEVGHAAQNVYVQAAALGLGTTFVGAFQDNQVKRILGLPAAEHPLGLMPLGRPE